MAMKKLGVLLGDSIDFVKKRFMVLLVGAVVFGLLSQMVAFQLVGPQISGWQQKMSPWMEKMDGSNTRMQELAEKMQNGQVTDADMQELEAMGKDIVANMPNPAVMTGMLGAMLPSLGLAFILSLVIGLLAKSYYTLVAVKNIGDAGKAVSSTFSMFFPMVGLWIWMFLRSFVWIPIVGVIIAIIVGPRLILSPLYLLEHKKGILESTRMSYTHTRGMWGKIFGNALCAGICIMIVSAIASWIVGSVLGTTGGMFAMGIVSQLLSAFLVVFVIQLGRTVMAQGKA